MNKMLTLGIIATSEKARNNVIAAIAKLEFAELLWVASHDDFDTAALNNNKPDIIIVGACDRHDQPVQTTATIMDRFPTPILLVCDSVADHASVVFEAMGKGALDVVGIAGINHTINDAETQEISAKLKTIGTLLGSKKAKQPRHGFTLIAIGASTGGPTAIAELLKTLPSNFPAAIVIVQHIDQQFSSTLAQWLNSQTSAPVSIAIAGQPLHAGQVYLAAGNSHLQISADAKFSYTVQPENSIYTPCIDVFFHSVAQHWQGNGIGVLLTGMGDDGAHGLLGLHKAGFYTLTQDQSSCAVFGMPAAAAALNAADVIDTPVAISSVILHKLGIEAVDLVSS